MPPDHGAETFRLFTELVELDAAARDARLDNADIDHTVAGEVTALLAAASRSGDFLGILRSTPGGVAASSPSAGDLVAGRYAIERQIGSGAMGDVFLASDRQLERPVALKFLRAAGTALDPDAVARFRGEARAAARLDHAHVATVHDAGEAAGRQLYIAMAYYPGETLRERLQRAPLSRDEALLVAAQVAGALAAAHAAGIVHRDVKPANVLFDAAGGARLADFGIATLLGNTEGDGTGRVLGTPAYMSPEQARGEAADASTDLWALGVMLHEMLTGGRIREHGAIDDTLDDGVRVLIAGLLAEERDQRTRDAAAVRRSLEALREPAPDRARGTDRSSLPVPLTTLVGRDRELEAAHGLLKATRLLTLTGAGGTGKSRLALALASRHRTEWPDGVWYVPLAEIADAALVPTAIALAFGVRDLGTTPLAERVLASIGTRCLLLVVDNFEHVLIAAPFVVTLLAACPGVTMLATSRAALGVDGEQLFPVPPLSVPGPLSTDVAACDSVQLFVSRARAARPGFTLDDDALGAVAEICRRLDGLPLAIELAAARAALLSPRAILARLEQRFDLLRGDLAGRPSRHATMRAVMDWSFVLLSDEERSLFCRLAVFAGGASLASAEAVANVGGGDAGERTALDLVASLASKSLIQVEEQPDGEPRLSMLETVREFGLDRLAAGPDSAAARRAHLAQCVALAEAGAAQLRGPAQATWLDRLEREYPNFRVALDGALADPVDGLHDAARLAIALHRLWLTRGPLFEGIEYLERLRAVADAPDAPRLEALPRARLLSGAAHLAGTRSLFGEARALFARSLLLFREAGDRAGTAATLANLGWQTWNMGDLDAGEALSREAIAMHESLGDTMGIALARNNLAWIATERGAFDDAARHFDDVIASHQARGDLRSVAFTMSWRGVLAARRGDVDEAAQLFERSIVAGDSVADIGYRTLVLVRLAAARHARGQSDDEPALVASAYLPALRGFGRLWPLAYALTELGSMRLDLDDVAGARAVLDEALEARRASRGMGGMIETLTLSGVVAHRAGDLPGAARHLAEALAMARTYRAPPHVVACVEAVAPLAAEAGHPEVAAMLLCAADSALGALGARRTPRQAARHAARREALRDVMGDERHERACAGGGAMSLDAAASLAAEELHIP